MVPLAYLELDPEWELYIELARGSSGCGIGSVMTALGADEDKRSNSRSNGSERNLLRRSSNGSLVNDDVRRDEKILDMVFVTRDDRCTLTEWALDRRNAASPAAVFPLLLYTEEDGGFRMPRNGCGDALGSTACASENGLAAGPRYGPSPGPLPPYSTPSLAALLPLALVSCGS